MKNLIKVYMSFMLFSQFFFLNSAMALDVENVKNFKVVVADETQQVDTPAVEMEPTQSVKPVLPTKFDPADAATQRKARQDELEAMRAKEQLQFEETRLREQAEKKRAEFEYEMALKKKHIFELQQKEKEYSEQIEKLKFDIADIEGKNSEFEKTVKAAEQREKIQATNHAESKQSLERKKTELAASLNNLVRTREETSKKINTYLVQMQQMRAEASNYEASIARAENEKVRAESEELQLRTQWSALSAQTESMREEKERILASLIDAKARLDIARKDFQQMKLESDKTVKEKIALEQESLKKKNEINAEMRKLEQETSFAYSQKATAEAEKVRLAAEIESLREKLVYAQQRNEEAKQQYADSQGAIMESRLAYETAKSDLVNAKAEGEAAKLRHDAKMMKIRSLASVAESSDMLEAHKPWVATKDCKITRTPASTKESSGYIKSGDRVIAAPGPSGFVKILNTSGRPVYVPASCGKFTE